MTYLSDKARKRPKYILYTLCGIVVFLIAFFWGPIRGYLYTKIEPVVRMYGMSKSVTGNIMQSLPSTASKKELIAYNQALENNIETLENRLAQYEGDRRESSLITSTSTTDRTIVLYPIMQDVTHLYSTLLFGKGKRDGLYTNQILFVRGMQPVCVLIEVYESTSLCELLSKGGDTTEGVVIAPSATSSLAVTLTGEGGGAYTTVVPKEAIIAVGDEVYLRSNQHMKIGIITSIIRDDQAIGLKAYIQGAYNPLTSSIFYGIIPQNMYGE